MAQVPSISLPLSPLNRQPTHLNVCTLKVHPPTVGPRLIYSTYRGNSVGLISDAAGQDTLVSETITEETGTDLCVSEPVDAGHFVSEPGDAGQDRLESELVDAE
jgi:hypothetical protein